MSCFQFLFNKFDNCLLFSSFAVDLMLQRNTSVMSKKRIEKRKELLEKKELESLATWIKSDGADTFRHIFEKKSEVEKLVERMSVVDEKAIREPYTV
jgi:hypothetical protein